MRFGFFQAVLVLTGAVLTNSNPLNDYLTGKTFGANPGPCSSEQDKCTADWANLPEKIKEVRLCLIAASWGCFVLKDVVESGFFEIWNLQCKNVQIGDASMTQTRNELYEQFSRVDVTNFRLACEFRTNVYDLFLSPFGDGFIGQFFRLKVNVRDTQISFPARGTSGSVSTSIKVEITTAQPESFADELPYEIDLPADECDISTGLGIRLQQSQIRIDAISLPIGIDVNNDGILSLVAQILEVFIGGIICQFIENLAFLSNPTRDGILNAEWKKIKVLIDDAADVGEIDPVPFDTDAEIIKAGLTSDKLSKALNFANSTVVELLSVGLNGWLGATSTTPGYEGRLVINELVDQVTRPDGTVKVDLQELDLAPEITLPLNVTDLTARINSFALKGINTFDRFEILQNSYDQEDPSNRLRYTFVNKVNLQKLDFEVVMYINLAPGEWVTAGTGSTAFTFSFALSMQNLLFDVASRILFDFDRLSALQIGQITTLIDKLDTTQPTDEIASFLTDALQCFSPAFYDLNLTDLELSLGGLDGAKLTGNFDSDFIEDSIQFGYNVIQGGLRSKLLGLSRGVIRTTVNDLIQEYVVVPGQAGTAKCPSYVPPAQVPVFFTIDFTSGIFATVYQFIGDSVGGNPIADTATDINELVDVVISYYADNVPNFPFVKVNNQQGYWRLSDAYTDVANFPAYQRPFDKIHLAGFSLENLNKIYRLTAEPADARNGGVKINFGLGGELAGTPPNVKTPLIVEFLFVILRQERPSEGVVGVREEFTLGLQLSDIDTTLALTKIVLVQSYFNELFFSQIQSVPCLLGGLYELILDEKFRALSIGDILPTLDRNIQSTESNKLNDALTALKAELDTKPEYPRFDTLLNTIMNNALSLVLDQIETIPELFSRGQVTAENCSAASDPLDLLYEWTSMPLPNLTASIEECLEPVDFTKIPSISQVEDTVVYDEKNGDEIFDLSKSALVGTVSNLLDQALKDGGIAVIVERLANSTGSLIADAFVFDEEDPTKVNAIFPLSVFGLRLTDDNLIPGLVVDAGNFIIKGVNKFLQDADILNPVGAFTTQHKLIFDKSKPLDVSIEAFVEMDRSAVDGPTATGKVREQLSINFTMTEFLFDMDIVTAFNPKVVAERTLGHFLRADNKQTLFLSSNALDCFVDMFYENGLQIRKLQVDVQEIAQVAVASKTREILSENMEAVFAAVADLVIDFYKEAVTSIGQNCVVSLANNMIRELQSVAQCPTTVSPPPLEGDNAIFRFSSQADFNLFQDLWNEFLVQDQFENLNVVLKDVLGKSVFLSEADGDQIEFEDIPVIYYRTSYGSVDLGLSNIRLENLGFSDLRILEPYVRSLPSSSARRMLAESSTSRYEVTSENIDYVTLTRFALPGPFSIQFDLKFNAQGLFQDIPDMQNKVRVKLTFEDFDLATMLLIKLNMTDMLALPFGTVSDLQQLPCLLIPLEELVPMEFNLTAKGLSAQVDCLDRCDLPFFKALETAGAPFTSTNSEEIGELLTRSLDFVASYLAEIDAQRFVDLQLANSETNCADLLETIGDFFQDVEDPADIASKLGIGFASVTLALFAAFGCVYPVHKIRRKQALLANISDNEKEIEAMDQASSSAELARIMASTELGMKSIFQHPVTPVVAKFLFPFVALTNMGLTVVAVAFSGALSLVIKLTILGAESVLWEVVPLTFGSLINTLWEEMGWAIGLVIALATAVFPILQNLSLLLLWFTPSTVLNVDQKRSVISSLELTAKVGFIIILVIATTIAALYTVFEASDYKNLSFVETQVAGFELNVSPKRGMVFLALIACSTLVLTHCIHFFMERTVNNNKKLRDEIDGLRDAASGPSKAFYAKRRLIDHVFLGRDKDGNQRKVNKKVALGLIASAAIASVLITVGLFIPSVTFEVNGIAGIILREVSDGSPTLEEPLQTKVFSLAKIGSSFGWSPKLTVGDAIGAFVLQLAFFISYVIAPILQIFVLQALLLLPFNLRSARNIMWFERICICWNAMELACVTLLAMLFIIPPLVRTYVNFISSVIVSQDFCVNLQDPLRLAVPDEKDAYCMDVQPTLNAGYFVLVVGVLIQLSTTYIFSVLLGAALSDRYYAAYNSVRSDAKPKRLGKLAIKILNLCTVPVSGVQDEGAEDQQQRANIHSVFDRESLKDRSPSLFQTCLAYYGCCTGPSDSSISDTESRINAWRERFEGNGGQIKSQRSSGNPLFERASKRPENPFSTHDSERTSFNSRVRAESIEV